MTGWVIFLGLSLIILGVLWRVARLPVAALQLLGAALLIGAAGFAWQSNPGLPGKPTPPHAEQKRTDSMFALERLVFFERFGFDGQLLDAADAMHRAGLDDYGVALLRGGLRKHPRSPALWTAMGYALTLYADGIVTPAADLAFQRAADAAPGHPGPVYFRGLAYAESGQFAQTDAIWSDLLNHTPPDAPWRREIERKRTLLRDLQARAAPQ